MRISVFFFYGKILYCIALVLLLLLYSLNKDIKCHTVYKTQKKNQSRKVMEKHVIYFLFFYNTRSVENVIILNKIIVRWEKWIVLA